MENYNTAVSPMVKGFHVENYEEVENCPFREVIGTLMYVSTATRPDIAYATGCLRG